MKVTSNRHRKHFSALGMFTNVFLLSPETYSPEFIVRSPLSTFSISLLVLLQFCWTFWCMIVAVKTKTTTALQIKRLARLFGYDIFFCCGTGFFNLRVPEWKEDNTNASWNDELQTTCAWRKWRRKLFVLKMHFKSKLFSKKDSI